LLPLFAVSLLLLDSISDADAADQSNAVVAAIDAENYDKSIDQSIVVAADQFFAVSEIQKE